MMQTVTQCLQLLSEDVQSILYREEHHPDTNFLQASSTKYSFVKKNTEVSEKVGCRLSKKTATPCWSTGPVQRQRPWKHKTIYLCTVSAHITSRDLKLAKLVEQLQVLRHGVNAVRWCEESLGLSGKNGRQLGDVGAEERLHELLHEIPAIPRNHTRTVLHLGKHSMS